MTYNKYEGLESNIQLDEIIPRKRKQDWYSCIMTGVGKVCTSEKNIMKLEEMGYEIIELYFIARANLN